MFQVAVAKASKKERLPKIASCGSNHLREIHVVFKLDVDGLPDNTIFWS
jgi:hypothetical protein